MSKKNCLATGSNGRGVSNLILSYPFPYNLFTVNKERVMLFLEAILKTLYATNSVINSETKSNKCSGN